MLVSTRIIGLVFLAIAAVPQLDAAIQVERLRCEYLRNPIGIDETQPRLSWEIRSHERGEKQTAWQVLVASTPDALALDQGDLWDSGKVPGDATNQVAYQGTALGSRAVCYWKVRSWNKDDQVSAWSETATWSIGLLDAADWSARWIDGMNYGPDASQEDPPVVVEAFYEALNGSGSLDVTAQLTALQGDGNYLLQVTNGTFGSDPAFGSIKQLRVVYEIDGETITKTFAEDSVMIYPTDLPAVVYPVIEQARYESLTSAGFNDVTATLVQLSESGAFALAVNNTTLGPDPTPNQAKRLRITYSVNGVLEVATFPENATFNYPADLPMPVDVVVTSASYEAIDGAGSLDVTADLTDRAQEGPYSIAVNNDTFGSDPAYNHVKRLRIDYQLNGIPLSKNIAENSVFNYPGDLAESTNVPYLRKSFPVSKTVRKATLHATALGLYELRLNGSRVGDQILAPEWTDYSKRINYQTYDVTSQLVTGANALGAQVANGWYAGHIGNGGFQRWGVSPALLAQLEITYDDGTSERIVTDGSWKMHPSPTLATDFMLGEDYDAREELAGWDAPGFDDSSWSHNLIRPEAARIMDGLIMEPARELMEITPQALSQPAPGRWTYDLGQNMVGVVRLKITADAGTRITLRHAEMLNSDGTIYTANLRGAPSIDTYVCKGGGEETWQPKFTFHGFRYVELTGVSTTPPLDAVTGIVIGSESPQTGEFACSDGFINQLHSNIQWGQRGNYLSVPTDCPQRDERLGWMGDAQVFVRTATYNADIAAFFTKWLVDVTDAQTESGGYTDVSPNTGTPDGTPAWGDAGVICPWTIYQAYGDVRLLEKNYPAMVKWIEWCQAHSTASIRDHSRGGDYGDWLSINADTSKELIGTAYYAYSTRLVARAAAVLGKTADASQYESLFQTIKAAFIAKYVNQSTGAITGNTQCAYVMALKFDLLPQNLRAAATQLLENDVLAKGTHLSTGFVGVSYLLPALTSGGKTDTAYDLLLQDTFPSWLFSVKHGATTIWERWDGWTPQNGFQNPGMNSFNHYSLGSCGEWLYGSVAGIDLDPAIPAYKKSIIRPRPGTRLDSAQGSLHSIHGLISTAWRSYPGGFVLNTTIPANTTAEVHVPATDAASVMESGIPAADSSGVTFLRMEDGAAVFDVESGRFRFTTGTSPEPGADSISHDPGVPVKMRLSTLLENDGAGPFEFVSAGPFSVNGAAITEEDGWIHFTPQAGDSGPDSFIYTLRDASGGISTRSVQVGIIPADAPVQHTVSIEIMPDGSRTAKFEGVPGRVYRIESSETMDGSQAWITRKTVQADEDGSFEITDPLPLPACRFYRAVFP